MKMMPMMITRPYNRTGHDGFLLLVYVGIHSSRRYASPHTTSKH